MLRTEFRATVDRNLTSREPGMAPARKWYQRCCLAELGLARTTIQRAVAAESLTPDVKAAADGSRHRHAQAAPRLPRVARHHPAVPVAVRSARTDRRTGGASHAPPLRRSVRALGTATGTARW